MERKYLGYGLGLLILVLSLGTTACRYGVDDSSPAATSPKGTPPPAPWITITGFHYSFDADVLTDGTGVITDQSSNSFDATGISLSSVTGIKGNAVNFTEEGSAIEMPPVVTYFQFENGFTFRAWIKPNTVSGTQQIIGSATELASGQTDNISLALADDGIEIKYSIPGGEGTLSTGSIGLGADWIHIAVTYETTFNNIVLYVNGLKELVEPISPSFTPAMNNRIGNNLVFSGGSTAILNQFYGAMDEVILENETRTWGEIVTYYNNKE